MKRTTVIDAIVKFFKTTTLHGFKYLVSQYYHDRIGWALGCLASACCAGVLCVVLWQRFLLVPALLRLRDGGSGPVRTVPTVAVCQPVDAVAEEFLNHAKTNGADTSRLPSTLAHAFRERNNTDETQLKLLQELLELNNVTLLEMLQWHTAECSQLMRYCRWLDMPVNCDQLFRKELTLFGVCCVATPARLSSIPVLKMYRLGENKRLDIGLQCFQGTGVQSCEFFTRYGGEEWFLPTRMSPGYNHLAHLSFVAADDSDTEKLVDDETCVSSAGYSRSHCLLKCMEKKCGCTDPLRKIIRKPNEIIPPPCPLTRLSCLRTFGINENYTCACLPACQKIITQLIMDSSPYNCLQSSLDPIYSGMNISQSMVLQLIININSSKFFQLKPTETWLTLLSSLGGVFNMFLGVGIFSALEFLFLIFVKLPIAIRRSTEMVPSATTATIYRVK